MQVDFYPRSPCGERRRRSVKLFRQNYISIHALLAESDLMMLSMVAILILFLSTLSLRRATLYINRTAKAVVFLSTLSLRRATGCQRPCEHPTRDFYPRSPCGERPANWFDLWGWRDISIHALLAESDRLPTALRTPHQRFLSTLSLRRATRELV